MQDTQAHRRAGRLPWDRRRQAQTRRGFRLLLATVATVGLSAEASAIPGKPGQPPLQTVAAKAPRPAKRSGGVGMVLDGRRGRIVVARVVPGGPAARAGVRGGDVVLAVDGVPVAPGAPVGKVAGMVRGPVGGSAALRVQRAGEEAPIVLRVRRADLSLLFPKRAEAVLVVEPGLSLIATSGRWSLGVTFPRGGDQADLLTYQWALVPAGRKLAHASAQRGLGAVAWGRGGATVQIADWRLDLKPWPARGKLIVAASNLPLAKVDGQQWVQADPATARYVRPRPAPQSYRTTWPVGRCTMRLLAQRDGEAVATHRLTLRLTDATGVARPSATVRTDGHGVALLRLPAGRWTINGLHPSLSGAHRDLFYAARAPAAMKVRCPAGQTVEVTLATTSRAASTADSTAAGGTTLPAAAFQHALVGRPLAKVAVQRWLGGDNPLPKTLKGKVLLVYLWATWCGPCKRVSPMIAELHARLADRGLIVVPTSVDRDLLALEDYVDGEAKGAAAVAWVGPQPLAKLPIRGVPTVVAIDDEGIVRAVHTGTGVSVEAWTRWLTARLDEAQGRRKRTRAPARGAPPAAQAGRAQGKKTVGRKSGASSGRKRRAKKARRKR